MQIQIASDLHLEFRGSRWHLDDILEVSAPVLALLGDIGVLGDETGRSRFEEFIQECCQRYEQVLYLCGNHEFYCKKKNRSFTHRAILDYLRELDANWGNFVVMDNRTVLINDVAVIGSTLWSFVPECQTVDGAVKSGGRPYGVVETYLNDYRLILVDDQSAKGGIRVATVADTNRWHAEAVDYLSSELTKCDEQGIRALVLTHHAPSFRGTSHPRFDPDPNGTSSGFCSELEGLMAAHPSLHTWCFGHTHFNSDQMFGRVRVLSNQCGYPHEAQGLAEAPFIPNIVVQVLSPEAPLSSPPPLPE